MAGFRNAIMGIGQSYQWVGDGLFISHCLKKGISVQKDTNRGGAASLTSALSNRLVDWRHLRQKQEGYRRTHLPHCHRGHCNREGN